MYAARLVKRLCPIVAAGLLAACGGSDGGDDDNTNPDPAPTNPSLGYLVGGNVSGLGNGKNFMLQNNAADNLRVLQNGKFSFDKAVSSGGAYAVTILTQPDGQTCKVSNGTGTASADVSNVTVACADNAVDPAPGTGGGTDPGNGNGSGNGTGTGTDDGGIASCLFNPHYEIAGSSYTTHDGVTSSKAVVMGPATYRGHNAVRVRYQTSLGSAWDSYSKKIDNSVFTYGTVLSAPSVHETYFSPAMKIPLDLQLNQTFTQNTNQITVQPGAPDFTVPVTYTTKYVGREKITTAFGAFETCRIEFSTVSSVNPLVKWTHWYVASGKLSGFVVQTDSADGRTQPTNIEVSWN